MNVGPSIGGVAKPPMLEHAHTCSSTNFGSHGLTQSSPLQSALDAGLSGEPADSGVMLASCVMSADCTTLSIACTSNMIKMTPTDTSITLLQTDDLSQ